MVGVAVMSGDMGYVFHSGSPVVEKINGWIEEDLRNSRHDGSTMAYEENDVYNFYVRLE